MREGGEEGREGGGREGGGESACHDATSLLFLPSYSMTSFLI